MSDGDADGDANGDAYRDVDRDTDGYARDYADRDTVEVDEMLRPLLPKDDLSQTRESRLSGERLLFACSLPRSSTTTHHCASTKSPLALFLPTRLISLGWVSVLVDMDDLEDATLPTRLWRTPVVCTAPNCRSAHTLAACNTGGQPFCYNRAP